MGLLDTAREIGWAFTHVPTILRERNMAMEVAADLEFKGERLQESLMEIEAAIDEIGWREMGSLGSQTWNFKRNSIKKMMDLSRRMYIMNPLMRRSIDVQALYIWALGYTVSSKNKDVEKVLENFFCDPQNESVFSSQPALEAREKDQQQTGNTFFALWVNHNTGSCRMRVLPVDEVQEVITNPEDSKDVWYYRRSYTDAQGRPQEILYADCNHYREDQELSYKNIPVQEAALIFHLKTGGLADMLFGLPELISIFEWIISYKKMLNNWASILQAYARMAMKLTGAKGKKDVAATKARLGTGVQATSRVIDNNPPTNVGGWFAASGGMDISAVRTAGATTSAAEGKPLKDMAAAGAGIPSHFYGDSDSGNFATSTTLDRPTELKFVSRQKLWLFLFESIVEKLILFSAQAPNGILKKASYTVTETENLFNPDEPTYEVTKGEEDMFVEISFPDILERNVTERVRAAVAAITLGGSSAEGIIPDRKVAAGMLLEAMGVSNWQEVLEDLYPESVIQGFIDPKDQLENEKKKAQGAADLGTAAVNQAAVSKIVANKPTPKPAGASGSRGSGGVSNRR